MGETIAYMYEHYPVYTQKEYDEIKKELEFQKNLVLCLQGKYIQEGE